MKTKITDWEKTCTQHIVPPRTTIQNRISTGASTERKYPSEEMGKWQQISHQERILLATREMHIKATMTDFSLDA